MGAMDDLEGETKRLPLYLIIDTSGSMSGPPILAVNEGMKLLENILRTDATFKESVDVCVLRFDSTAAVAVAQASAEKFSAPSLTAQGGTAYSLAFALLKKEIDKNQRPKSEDYAGDYKPLAFFFTDGEPNPGDPWREALTALNESKGKRPQLVAIGAGPAVKEAVLREIAPEHTHVLQDLLDSSQMHALIQFIVQSTVAASRSAGVLPPAPVNPFGQSN